VSARRRQTSAYDVVVVGGGMVGSLLACALGDSALKVAVIEPRPAPEPQGGDFDLRVSALTLATRTMLAKVGAWEGVLRRRSAPVRAMRVWQAGGPGEIEFDAAEIGEPYLAYIVENSVIVAALRERLDQFTNVHVVDGAVADLGFGELAELTLVDDRRLNARIVVGADGADSAVRRGLHVPLRSVDMKQQGIVATVHTALTHDDTARQVFLSTGPLAFLPLPDSHACSIVWSVDNARAEALLALDDAAFLAELANAFGTPLGAIRSVSRRAAFPLALSHADRYVRERVALIGDAAHTVHPLAGQGVNLGFLDAAALAEVLLAAVRERRDIGAMHVLRRYERWRKGDNLTMIAATGGFKYLFGNDWRLVTGLRGAGLSLTNRMTPVKKLIMRRASGLIGDLPTLARPAGGGTRPTFD
jgi:2-octaprenylphenol hydroxylase